LERRTSALGKDRIDHGPGGHDDLANASAGALIATSALEPKFRYEIRVGMGIFRDPSDDVEPDEDTNFAEATTEFEAGNLSGRQLFWFLAERERRRKRGGR
jgi:hypothetical protein